MRPVQEASFNRRIGFVNGWFQGGANGEQGYESSPE
jgi:hypothetical protein